MKALVLPWIKFQGKIWGTTHTGPTAKYLGIVDDMTGEYLVCELSSLVEDAEYVLTKEGKRNDPEIARRVVEKIMLAND